MTGFFPTNQNTLYLLPLFYSDNDIITVHGRLAICSLIGWFKSSFPCLDYVGYPIIVKFAEVGYGGMSKSGLKLVMKDYCPRKNYRPCMTHLDLFL